MGWRTTGLPKYQGRLSPKSKPGVSHAGSVIVFMIFLGFGPFILCSSCIPMSLQAEFDDKLPI